MNPFGVHSLCTWPNVVYTSINLRKMKNQIKECWKCLLPHPNLHSHCWFFFISRNDVPEVAQRFPSVGFYCMCISILVTTLDFMYCSVSVLLTTFAKCVRNYSCTPLAPSVRPSPMYIVLFSSLLLTTFPMWSAIRNYDYSCTQPSKFIFCNRPY